VAADAGELAAQVADVAVYSPIGDGEARTVQTVDDGVAAEHPAGGGGQRLEDAELGNGQGDLVPRPAGAPGVRVEAQAAVADHRSIGLAPAWLLTSAAQDGGHPRRHFTGAERLDHIVIGAELDAQHPVEFVVAR